MTDGINLLTYHYAHVTLHAMQHRSIGSYTAMRYSPMSSVRVNGIHHNTHVVSLVSDYKPCSEKKPEPLQLSDVVWRATKAVEEADRSI
jgi:hypothetical protein